MFSAYFEVVENVDGCGSFDIGKGAVGVGVFNLVALKVDNTVDPIVSNILLDNALTSRRVLSSPETLSPLSSIGCIFFIGFYTVVGNDICGCCCEKSREDDDMEEPYFMGRPNKDGDEARLLFFSPSHHCC